MVSTTATAVIDLKDTIKRIPLLAKIPYESLTISALAGETNQNYLVSINNNSNHNTNIKTDDRTGNEADNNKYILRCPRKETNDFINREDEAYNAKICEALGLSPANVWREIGANKKPTGLSLSQFIETSRVTTANDFKNTFFLEKIAKYLIIFQTSKSDFQGVRDKQDLSKSLTEYYNLCNQEQKSALAADYREAIDSLANIDDNRALVPSHIDCTKENILISKEKLWFIDWEYSAMSSPFWDIATLCNSAEFNQHEAECFLKMVLKNENKSDSQTLKQYRFIAKTISQCWVCCSIQGKTGV